MTATADVAATLGRFSAGLLIALGLAAVAATVGGSMARTPGAPRLRSSAGVSHHDLPAAGEPSNDDDEDGEGSSW